MNMEGNLIYLWSSYESLVLNFVFVLACHELYPLSLSCFASNSSFQLPGFCMPPMLRDDDGGTDSDGESFEAVTPEHNVENLDVERTPVPAVEKRSHILEDVDGELEMEDVAPCCESEMTSTSNITGTDCVQLPQQQSDKRHGAIFSPQPSKGDQLASAPLPRSLPPPPPPPPHPIPSSGFPPAECDPMANGRESKHYPSSQVFYIMTYISIILVVAQLAFNMLMF